MPPTPKTELLNPLDRIIKWFAPQAGLRRQRARAMSEVLRAYDAARTGRRWENWLTNGGDANAALDGDLVTVRNRCRDLIRNNPHAARLKNIVAGGAVGTGIVPQADTGFPEVDGPINEAWKRHADECDADGQLDAYGIQRMVADAVFESGEVLARRRVRRPEDGFWVPLQYQVMESDHFDLSATRNTSGGVTVQGVEFDAIGRRSAYWLYPTHPGAVVRSLRDSLSSRPVPASEIAHVYKKTRPGQVHGAPALSTVVTLLRDMDEYNDAVITSVKTAACLGLFVKQSESPDGASIGKATTTDEQGNRIETMRPGMILYGSPGEEAEAIIPHGPANFVEYMRFEQSILAIGVDSFYSQFSGDLSAVNWASYRAGDREYRAAIEAFRWLYLIPMFLEVQWRWFIDAAYLAGRIPAPLYGVRWAPPQFMSVDPKKDAEADEAELANGAVSFPEMVGRRAGDPQRQLDLIAEWQKKADEKGIVFAWDRRKVKASGSQAGVSQEPQ